MHKILIFHTRSPALERCPIITIFLPVFVVIILQHNLYFRSYPIPQNTNHFLAISTQLKASRVEHSANIDPGAGSESNAISKKGHWKSLLGCRCTKSA
jgi:uncharacterized protein YpmB